VLRKAPPLPFLDEQYHGTDVLVFAALYSGDMEEGEKALKPISEFGEPLANVLMPHPYAGFQQAFDPLLTPGARNYWKSHNFDELSDAALDTVIEFAGQQPSGECESFIAQMGGAINDVDPGATAYPHRTGKFLINVHGRWQSEDDDEKCIGWSRKFFDALAPEASGSVYVNFMTEEEADRVRQAYGPNYDRMVEVKRKYDPQNLFHMNQNVQP
jgi:hypothetical protein